MHILIKFYLLQLIKSQQKPTIIKLFSFLDQRVTNALEMMKSMGFTDEDGWLTRLLERTGGDIAQALDTLKLGAEQANLLL